MPPFYIFPSNNKTMASYSGSFSFSVVGCLMVRKKREREEKREREKKIADLSKAYLHIKLWFQLKQTKKKLS